MTAGGGVDGLVHVLVLSDDLERARDFYERALGLQTGTRPPLPFAGYWLYAGSDCCLHLADRGEYRAHARTMGLDVPPAITGPGPADHVAFAARDLAAVTRRLADAGVGVVEGGAAPGPHQLFLDDPDGQRVEISIPRVAA
jgi:catechol 2,3-dioxygenase-like lactoylglutathione lyase family enzyme